MNCRAETIVATLGLIFAACTCIAAWLVLTLKRLDLQLSVPSSLYP